VDLRRAIAIIPLILVTLLLYGMVAIAMVQASELNAFLICNEAIGEIIRTDKIPNATVYLYIQAKNTTIAETQLSIKYFSQSMNLTNITVNGNWSFGYAVASGEEGYAYIKIDAVGKSTSSLVFALKFYFKKERAGLLDVEIDLNHSYFYDANHRRLNATSTQSSLKAFLLNPAVTPTPIPTHKPKPTSTPTPTPSPLSKSLYCNKTDCACLKPAIYYTYNGSVTKELYIGGYLHFPKTIADRIRVTGGVVEKEDQTGWRIRVTQSVVNVQYIKLSSEDFSYTTKTFKAKEYPAELYKPVSPDEMRLKLIELNSKLAEFEKDLKSIKSEVKAAAEKPTAGEQLMGFLLYFPPMWVVYAVLGVTGFLAMVGWWYGRD